MIPKTLFKTDMQLLTPCFCAGGEQTTPELRAPSFRGELRWWFRCLGGTREQESAVFGTVFPGAKASAVALLVTDVKRAPEFNWSFERPIGPKDVNSAYITYFLSANEHSDREDSVVRTEAYLPPGQRFTLELRQLRPIDDDAATELLALAWDCLCNLGALGARKTRGLGAYAPVRETERKAVELTEHPVVKAHFGVRINTRKDYGMPVLPGTATAILTDCAKHLKEYRKNCGVHPTLVPGQKPSTKHPEAVYGFSVLGNAGSAPGVEAKRQSSLVRFRPILTADGKLLLCTLKAPAETACSAALENDIKL